MKTNFYGIGKRPAYDISILVENRLPKAFENFTQLKAKNVVNSIIKRYREDLTKDVNPLEITSKIQGNIDPNL